MVSGHLGLESKSFTRELRLIVSDFYRVSDQTRGAQTLGALLFARVPKSQPKGMSKSSDYLLSEAGFIETFFVGAMQIRGNRSGIKSPSAPHTPPRLRLEHVKVILGTPQNDEVKLVPPLSHPGIVLSQNGCDHRAVFKTAS